MPDSAAVLTGDILLRHWLGHRRLTRRVIQAFPDDALFDHHAPSMRPFGAIVHEIDLFLPLVLRGAATGVWRWPEGDEAAPTTKRELLAAFDAATRTLEEVLPTIPAERFLEVDQPIGTREEPVVASLLYFLDNEVHHRGQGYVYLRELGIEPPAFYQR
jgi:uncharacterized damage-inducible protein DinB